MTEAPVPGSIMEPMTDPLSSAGTSTGFDYLIVGAGAVGAGAVGAGVVGAGKVGLQVDVGVGSGSHVAAGVSMDDHVGEGAGGATPPERSLERSGAMFDRSILRHAPRLSFPDLPYPR